MSKAELLTRGTIWLSILAYAIGSGLFALPERISGRDSAARVAWTIACISLIAHSICAYQFYHGWSHDAAYLDTARQTRDVVGFSWGGGLFINYALMVGWVVDIGWWWLSGLGSYRARPWPLVFGWHGFLIFIIFNATVVFKDGTVRWLGLATCISLGFTWILVAKQRSTALK
jgi:hypothetical protein